MLWGGGEDIASIVADVNRWAPHAEAVSYTHLLSPSVGLQSSLIVAG